MIDLHLADSLKFDYSKLKDKKIDLIFTNPPAFNPDKILFASSVEQHVVRMLTWFRSTAAQLNIKTAFIHLVPGKFIHMTPKHEEIIDFPVEEA